MVNVHDVVDVRIHEDVFTIEDFFLRHCSSMKKINTERDEWGQNWSYHTHFNTSVLSFQ